MIPRTHPRYQSLQLRAKIVAAHQDGILADSGMIAHGRGEAFDYLLGEKTTKPAMKSIRAAAAALLLAENPVISVNGNTVALVAEEILKLAEDLDAKVEINLFYRTPERVNKIEKLFSGLGAKKILGTETETPAHLNGLEGPRSRASPEGVYIADCVLVPLEDGDRAEALVANGKRVITVDLNPLSRTSQTSSITIVDNVVRTIPQLREEVKELKKMDNPGLQSIINDFDNHKNLQDSLEIIAKKYIHG